jgi:cytoskeletal protein RodZ
MKLSSGKRIGQSGHELATAAIFSFALHILAFGAAFLFYTVTPKFHAPPYYNVKLVDLPSGISETQPAAAPAPGPVKPEQKPQVKEKKSKERKAPAQTKKGGIPELAKSKTKPEKREVEEAPEEASAKQRAGQSGAAGTKAEGVAVTATAGQQDPKVGKYLELVKGRIAQYWNPPPDSQEAKARIVFSISRSGQIGNVQLVEDQTIGSTSFRIAAKRAILGCISFPPFFDDIPKQTIEVTVDLTATE